MSKTEIIEAFYRDTAQKLYIELVSNRDKLEKEYSFSGLMDELSMDEYAARISAERADTLTYEVFKD